MTRLIIVRHGQTEWNTLHKMQGQQDSPLTATGRELARRLGVRLQNTHIDGVFTSPLGRAAATARLITEGRNLPIIEDERLKELDLGRWEGEDMRTIEQRYPIDFDWFWQDPNRYMEIRGGETYDALLKRTRAFLNDMAAREGTYLVVTHAIALRTIRQNVLGLASRDSQMSMPSCCMCQIDIDAGRYAIRVFGDRYHHDDSIFSWWHGSPEQLTTLRAGSTITRVRPLAEAFSHKPEHVVLNTDSTIEHDGTRLGYLYRIAEEVRSDDVTEHPHTTMPLTYEFVTKRDLKLELAAQIDASAPLDIPADDPNLTLKV